MLTRYESSEFLIENLEDSKSIIRMSSRRLNRRIQLEVNSITRLINEPREHYNTRSWAVRSLCHILPRVLLFGSPKFTRVILKGGSRIRQGSCEVAHQGEAHRVVQNSGFTIKITILLCSRLTES